jgi:hypothetical protein
MWIMALELAERFQSDKAHLARRFHADFIGSSNCSGRIVFGEAGRLFEVGEIVWLLRIY